MKNLAKVLSMHIKTKMERKSMHTFAREEAGYLGIPGLILYLFIRVFHSSILRHTNHTFKYCTLIYLNLAFPTLTSEFYALVHKHLQP